MIKVLKEVGIVLTLVIVTAGAYYFLFRQTPKTLLRRARKFHQKGEKYFLLGDAEIANEYYTRSNKLREKALRLN